MCACSFTKLTYFYQETTVNMISSRLWLTHGARRGAIHEWEATIIILYRVKRTEAWADGCGTSYPSRWECLYSLEMGSAGLMCVWSADQLLDFIVVQILAGREMHKRCYMMLHVVTNMGHHAQMLFHLKRRRHDGHQPPASCKPSRAVIHHVPPHSWRCPPSWETTPSPAAPT